MNDNLNRYAASGEPIEAVGVVDQPKAPWGFWATVGLSAAVLGVFVAIQTTVAVPFVVAELHRRPGIGPRQLTEDLESNGLLLALATLSSAPACIGLTVLFAKLRGGMSARQYLALGWVSKRTLLSWCLLVMLFMIVSDGLTYLVAREVVPREMARAYQTAGFVPLLWIALIAAAPLFEEIFFRGFLFQGLRHSRLGGGGAVVLTALAWAAIHMQYDAYQMFTVFLGGLLLGTARLKTQSVYLTIAMHVVWNIIATVETAIFVSA